MQGREDIRYLCQFLLGGLTVHAHGVVDARKDKLLARDVVGVGRLLAIRYQTDAFAQHFEPIHNAALPGQFAHDLAPVGHNLIARQQTQQRGLARAVAAEHGPVLTGIDGPVDVVQHGHAIDKHRSVLDGDTGRTSPDAL